MENGNVSFEEFERIVSALQIHKEKSHSNFRPAKSRGFFKGLSTLLISFESLTFAPGFISVPVQQAANRVWVGSINQTKLLKAIAKVGILNSAGSCPQLGTYRKGQITAAFWQWSSWSPA